MATIASDVNFTLLNGHLNVPTTNAAAARRTCGLIPALSTNVSQQGTALTSASCSTDTITVTHALNNGDKVVFTNIGAASGVVEGRVYYVVSKSTTVSFKVAETSGGSAITLGTATVDLVALRTAALTDVEINTFIQGVYDNGGMRGGNPTLLVNSAQKIAVSKAYASAYLKASPVNQANVGGVVVDTVLTDFGGALRAARPARAEGRHRRRVDGPDRPGVPQHPVQGCVLRGAAGEGRRVRAGAAVRRDRAAVRQRARPPA